MTSGPDIGRYDPFEDTGDWPFRDAPPKRDEMASSDDAPPEIEQRAIVEDTELDVGIEEDELVEPAREPSYDDVPAPLEMQAEHEALPEPPAERDEDLEPGPVLAASAAVEEIVEADVVEEEPVEEEPVEEEHEGEAPLPAVPVHHAPGALAIPPGVDVLEGGPHGFRRNVAVVVSRFNGDISTGLLESAIAALRDCNVGEEAITVVPVPGAFELPLAALALAKTRRFACVVALGCVIRGETPHFDLIANEAASGLQLAAIETGIPVAFGVITTETREQAEERIDRGGEAARTALEMADVFSHVRTRAAAS